jgi:ubiquinone/menaquinone biosynthesis C-methylase UbiE
LEIIKAKKIFEHAPETPTWLERDILETLQQKYHLPPVPGYDLQSLEQRGNERARKILNLIRTKTEKINTLLELGCWDGMVSCALQRMGKITTAIDNRSKGFDKRAIREGVRLLQMDATYLQFEDESFDFVFSYDAFEHFAEPESVLQEAIRVVKTGGYIYLDFGPLYMSPMGLHAYRSITVPYCQLLFPKELLQNFVNEMGLETINFDQLSGWPLEDYRKMWNDSHRLKRVMYEERHDLSHLDLIIKYPSCFKSETKYFDNLIVSSIKVLFKKIR